MKSVFADTFYFLALPNKRASKACYPDPQGSPLTGCDPRSSYLFKNNSLCTSSWMRLRTP
jgi:hypothetical protein